MRKLLLAVIATFGLCASSMASEKTTSISEKNETVEVAKTEAEAAKGWRCSISVTIYRDGFPIGHDVYITTTNGTCNAFFKSVKKMYSDLGFAVN